MIEMSAAHPLLSVIIPTRHRNRQLRECLLSLAAQDYARPLWEAVVVFDGDDTRPDTALTAMAGQIPLIIAAQQHSGCGIARNTGASHARGRFLIFTDDDCLFPPDWLSRYALTFQLNPECLIAGHAINALPANPYSQTTQDLTSFLQEYAGVPLAIGNNFGVPAAGFRELGGFHPRYFRNTAEDRDFCLRWKAAGRPSADGAGIVVHHAHPLSLRSFLRQHYNYGRGAFVLHHAPLASHRQPANFYLSLLMWPASPRRGVRSARLWPFILASQCAHLTGYFRQWLRAD
jgi:glycosyltransferase involved in cell wall biosynthesis